MPACAAFRLGSCWSPSAVACTSMQSQYAVRRNNISCDQANRYAFQSMKSLGYTVTTFEPAAVGRAGRAARQQDRGGAALASHDGVVHIACEAVGGTARRGRRAVPQPGPDVHARLLSRLHRHRRPRHRPTPRMPTSKSGGATEGGVKFKIQPQLALETKLDFGEDLAAGRRPGGEGDRAERQRR